MSENKKTKLIIGLGNPGKDYDKTRHNIGFAVLDEFAFKQGLGFKKEKKFEAEVAMGDFVLEYSLKNKLNVKRKTLNEQEGETPSNIQRLTSNQLSCKLILAKPQTYMNDSGRAVAKLAQFYKIPPADILVIQDDVTMDTGKLRMAFDRGAGGQHGIEDIINSLGKRFHRLKVGVGPDPGGETRADYVLSCFPKKDKELVAAMIDSSVDLIVKWLSEEADIQLINTIKLSQ